MVEAEWDWLAGLSKFGSSCCLSKDTIHLITGSIVLIFLHVNILLKNEYALLILMCKKKKSMNSAHEFI